MTAPTLEALQAGLDRLDAALQERPLTTPPVDASVSAEAIARLYEATQGRPAPDLNRIEAALRTPGPDAETAIAVVPPECPTKTQRHRAKIQALGLCALTASYMVGGFFFAHTIVHSFYPLHLALCMGLGLGSGKLIRRWLDLEEQAHKAATPA